VRGDVLLEDPRPFLEAAGGRRVQLVLDLPPLPSDASISGWHSRLLEKQNSAALDYLTKQRGIALEVVKKYRVGWDGTRLIFPITRVADGWLAKTRLPVDRANMKCWRGTRGRWIKEATLYPDVPREHRRVLLVAGELDALCARSLALPATSVTVGAGTWRDEWTDALRGLQHVLVVFDNNEGREAGECVQRLQAAGISAARLDLRRLGVRHPKGDLSDFLNRNGNPRRLMARGRAGR
jgi:hypothetical protein